jgi:D-alanyl-D-alanine carboxypeptidase
VRVTLRQFSCGNKNGAAHGCAAMTLRLALIPTSPFTEAVMSGDKKLYRSRFGNIGKDQAEAICRELKRNDIPCMTIKN